MSGIEPDETAQPVNNANSDFLVSEDTLNIVTTDGQPDGAIDIIASARPTSVVSASAFVGGTSAGLGALTRDITVDITVEAVGSSVAASAEPALNDHDADASSASGGLLAASATCSEAAGTLAGSTVGASGISAADEATLAAFAPLLAFEGATAATRDQILLLKASGSRKVLHFVKHNNHRKALETLKKIFSSPGAAPGRGAPPVAARVGRFAECPSIRVHPRPSARCKTPSVKRFVLHHFLFYIVKF